MSGLIQSFFGALRAAVWIFILAVVAFIVLILGIVLILRDGGHGNSRSESPKIHAVSVTEYAYTKPKKLETPVEKQPAPKDDEEKCLKCGTKLSVITFTWEMPKGYVPSGAVWLGYWFVYPTFGAGSSWEMKKVAEIGPDLGGQVWAVTQKIHPQKKMEIDPHVGKRDAFNRRCEPKGGCGKDFGIVKISDGHGWSSTCKKAVHRTSDECVLERSYEAERYNGAFTTP